MVEARAVSLPPGTRTLFYCQYSVDPDRSGLWRRNLYARSRVFRGDLGSPRAIYQTASRTPETVPCADNFSQQQPQDPGGPRSGNAGWNLAIGVPVGEWLRPRNRLSRLGAIQRIAGIRCRHSAARFVRTPGGATRNQHRPHARGARDQTNIRQRRRKDNRRAGSRPEVFSSRHRPITVARRIYRNIHHPIVGFKIGWPLDRPRGR